MRFLGDPTNRRNTRKAKRIVEWVASGQFLWQPSRCRGDNRVESAAAPHRLHGCSVFCRNIFHQIGLHLDTRIPTGQPDHASSGGRNGESPLKKIQDVMAREVKFAGGGSIRRPVKQDRIGPMKCLISSILRTNILESNDCDLVISLENADRIQSDEICFRAALGPITGPDTNGM